ncbi:MAG: polysaccharide biosynthesis tyrosine autokinase [Clostridium sp.]|nr:polysaccharide biosynthesis tyrosine autokinase [Clostridium sp.]
MSEESKNQGQEAENSINFLDILSRSIANWYWFVASIALCMGIALWVILRTPPLYTQSASLLIKEQGKGKSMGSVGDAFNDFGMFTSNVNINNEMVTMRSSATVEEVVKRLGLEMNYWKPGRFHDQILYGKTVPLVANIVDAAPQLSASFTIEYKPDGKVTLSQFKVNGQEESNTATGYIGDSIATPAGVIIIAQGPAFDENSQIKVLVAKTSLAAAVGKYKSELEIAQKSKETSIVTLSITDGSVARADDVLMALITVYNENWVRDKNQIAVSTSMFINDRLGIIENELGNVDNDISSYKSEHLIPDVQAAASMYMNQATQAQTSITELNNQAYMARYVRNYLANDANKYELLPVTGGLADQAISAQITEYNRLLRERNSLANVSSDRNPLVQEMDANLSEIRSTMIASIDNQLVALNARIHSLQNVGNTATSKIASNPNQAKHLLSVERQQKVKESLYLYLLQKREENELSQAFTAYNTRITEVPGGSTAPVAPKKGQILLIAFVIGLAIPIGILVLSEMLNTVVRGRKDLDKLTVPYVGELPQADGKRLKATIPQRILNLGKNVDGHAKKESTLVAVKDGSRNVINEAFRVVRTNLEFMLGPDSHSVIAITSANPGSGKTFATFNLAAAFALKGKRVAVVDLDLRKGSLSKYGGKDRKSEGISDYLAGRVSDVTEIIVHNAAGVKVDLIPSGTLPPNPTELLFSPLLPELLETLKAHYDYVFLDCPPVEVVADTSIINKLADKTIFIIRAGLLERSMLPEIEKFYTTNKYQNMSILLNGTESSHGKYGYRYGYKYGYRYGSYMKED